VSYPLGYEIEQTDLALAQVLEDHIPKHMMHPGQPSLTSHEVAEDLINLVRAYLK
jgi:hypothetical protein